MRAGALRVQRCRCGAYRWPARAICNRCCSFDAEWVALSGKGTVTAWVTTHQPFAPGFKDEMPYDTVIVRLAEQSDLEMIGRLTPGVEPREGLAVTAVFQPVAEGTTLIYWKPV